jgi:hypothetical protein
MSIRHTYWLGFVAAWVVGACDSAVAPAPVQTVTA